MCYPNRFFQPVDEHPAAQSEEEFDGTKRGDTPIAEIVQKSNDGEKTGSPRSEG